MMEEKKKKKEKKTSTQGNLVKKKKNIQSEHSIGGQRSEVMSHLARYVRSDQQE